MAKIKNYALFIDRKTGNEKKVYKMYESIYDGFVSTPEDLQSFVEEVKSLWKNGFKKVVLCIFTPSLDDLPKEDSKK